MPIEIGKNFIRIRVRHPRTCDRRSFRVKDVGRPGHTKIVVCCPKGQWDAKRKRCRTGMVRQAILKPRKKK